MKLTKPVVVLDLETTGVWVEKDRIVEIGMIKCLLDGSRQTFIRRVNPGILIPPAVVELTGISNEAVKDEPPFKQIASQVVEFIGEADFGGFNV